MRLCLYKRSLSGVSILSFHSRSPIYGFSKGTVSENVRNIKNSLKWLNKYLGIDRY